VVTQEEAKSIFNKQNLPHQNSLLSELLLEQELQGKVLTETSDEITQKRKKRPCPHCRSDKVSKGGKQKEIQMYRCDSCSKWYSETTGTALYDIKLKSKWQSYLNCLEKGMPIKKIVQALDGVLADDSTLITDKHPSNKAYASDNPAIKHKRLLAKDHVDKNDASLHLQKVNNVHAQLRSFLRPFNGVSSKYLQNYLNWYSYAGQIQNSKTTIKQWFLAMLATDQAYALFELFKHNAIIY
jgi:transposase-like protein